MRETDKTGIPARRRACGNCGRLGHLTRTCRNPRKAHDKLGVEVEGWWRDLTATKRTADNWHMSGTEDGSLTYDRTNETEAYEFRTRPGSLGEAISQVVAIYPDKCDPSAGMHVHMSFADPADISLLASPEFLRYFRERWNAWGTAKHVHPSSDFWSRLRGNNADYCAINSDESVSYSSELQHGSRYRQLNFTSFRRHQTMEMRMLPLFRDARLAVSALEEWVCIVEDFLRDHANAYLAKFDREVALTSEDFAPVLTREGVLAIGEAATADTRETELDLSIAIDRVPARNSAVCSGCGRQYRDHYHDGDNRYCDRNTTRRAAGGYRTFAQEVPVSRQIARDVFSDLPLNTTREMAHEVPLPGPIAVAIPPRLFGGAQSVLNTISRTIRAEGVR